MLTASAPGIFHRQYVLITLESGIVRAWHLLLYVSGKWARVHQTTDCVQVPPTSDSDSTDEGHSGSTNHSDQELEEFKQQVNAAIQSLGGKVVPKLNWSAPMDALWISPTGLSCQNADEVLLLLKSSDRAAHDLACVRRLQGAVHQSSIASAGSGAAQGSEDQGDGTPTVRPQLVMKRYHKLDYGMEFRCFVKNECLVGISQRDPTQHFPALLDELPVVKAAILDFFGNQIASKFYSPDCAIFNLYANLYAVSCELDTAVDLHCGVPCT